MLKEKVKEKLLLAFTLSYYITIDGKRKMISGFRDVSSVYYCRNELKGTYYDRKALFAASRSLGHNRESIVAEHYLSSLKS